MDFYSHAPCGARRPIVGCTRYRSGISTHTPHAGRDYSIYSAITRLSNFYSHAPCGARPGFVPGFCLFERFLLTRPMRGSTLLYLQKSTPEKISTHTPHAGRDAEFCTTCDTSTHFYSHAPCGARHVPNRIVWSHWNFYSHAPCGARHARGGTRYREIIISTHTPHAGRDIRRVKYVYDF